jgi:hypothetical protein
MPGAKLITLNVFLMMGKKQDTKRRRGINNLALKLPSNRRFDVISVVKNFK